MLCWKHVVDRRAPGLHKYCWRLGRSMDKMIEVLSRPALQQNWKWFGPWLDFAGLTNSSCPIGPAFCQRCILERTPPLPNHAAFGSTIRPCPNFPATAIDSYAKEANFSSRIMDRHVVDGSSFRGLRKCLSARQIRCPAPRIHRHGRSNHQFILGCSA